MTDDERPEPEAPEAPAPEAAEPPLLPATYDENELRDAVGATQPADAPAPAPVPAPDDEEDKPRSRKSVIVGALSLVVGGGIAACAVLGHINSARLTIACESNRMVVERGRAFPPWGTRTLGGDAWKPLAIPPEAECHPRATEDVTELAGWYGKALVEQATSLLTAREVTKVDDAAALLDQALLVTRSLATDAERTNARKEIDRLQGDVGYWRASAKLRAASDALAAAAKEFDVAAGQRPAHVTDAEAWAALARKLVDELKAGPAGAQVMFPPLPPTDHPAAPPGVALPVEPAAETGSAAEAPPPPDAGVPSGGVLL